VIIVTQSPQHDARLDEASEAMLRGDFVKARDLLEILVSMGSKGALLGLAAIYERGGTKVPQDLDKARGLYERALSTAKSSKAALALGNMYYFGLGVQSDFQRAFYYYSKLESSADAVGLLRLGTVYERGQGIQQDPGKARDLYRRSAKLGNIIALKSWGLLELRRGNIFMGVPLWIWAAVRVASIVVSDPKDKRLRMY
jgi:hypothetical protein